LRERARASARQVAAGDAPDLSPFASAPAVDFEHLAGPPPRRGVVTPARLPSRTGGAGPVLIVGGPRNGGDVLAWALGLHASFEVRTGVEALDTAGRRPVVAGPAVAGHALTIADLYPDARVIWVERDVATTVASLVARPDAHGDFYTARSARGAAIALGRTCDLLEAAIGHDRVLRVGLARLVEDPVVAMRTILDFLGEEMFAACAAPFSGLTVDAGEALSNRVSSSPAEARRNLERRPEVVPPPLPARLHTLARGLRGDAIVAVVSRGDPALVDLPVGHCVHFPATPDGSYAGEYPPDGEAAVALLEDARGRGATHLLVPAPSSWWLTHYDDLRAHLDRRYRLVAAADGTGALYDLAGRRQRVAG
jgi:hypothetical protein